MFRFESFLVSWVFKCIRVSMGNLLGVEIDSVKKKKFYLLDCASSLQFPQKRSCGARAKYTRSEHLCPGLKRTLNLTIFRIFC